MPDGTALPMSRPTVGPAPPFCLARIDAVNASRSARAAPNLSRSARIPSTVLRSATLYS